MGRGHGDGSKHLSAAEREPLPESVEVQTKDPTVRLRVVDQEDEAIDPAVAALERQAALQGLHIAEPAFDLDRDQRLREGEQPVPGASITGDRERDLGPERDAGMDSAPKAFDQAELRGIANGIAVRVGPDDELESNRRARAAELLNREVWQGSALDSAELAVRHGDRSPGGGEAEPCVQSSFADLPPRLAADQERLPGRLTCPVVPCRHRRSLAHRASRRLIGAGKRRFERAGRAWRWSPGVPSVGCEWWPAPGTAGLIAGRSSHRASRRRDRCPIRTLVTRIRSRAHPTDGSAGDQRASAVGERCRRALSERASPVSATDPASALTMGATRPGPSPGQCSVPPVNVQPSIRMAGTTTPPRKPRSVRRSRATATVPASASR
jgi:hypothetical protein